ncbi:MAG: hypothetical protein QY321_00565 [Patescibacteria group bacterium]|nr:MAG: hypothetical protein QY321_00565 [Patescibacteria group bacterium]
MIINDFQNLAGSEKLNPYPSYNSPKEEQDQAQNQDKGQNKDRGDDYEMEMPFEPNYNEELEE